MASHLPHLSSALLAGLLVDGQAAALSLAGPGLMDTTRLAAGDSGLWREILALNATHVAALARVLGDRLHAAAALLEQTPDRVDSVQWDALRDLLEQGRRGRALVPVKHGLQESGFRQVTVVLEDAPGQLAALLQTAAAEQVNIEDVRVDHAFGHRTGRVGLWVTGADHGRLTRALVTAGWRLEERPPDDIGSTM